MQRLRYTVKARYSAPANKTYNFYSYKYIGNNTNLSTKHESNQSHEMRYYGVLPYLLPPMFLF